MPHFATRAAQILLLVQCMIRATIEVPGDKSITHRAIMFAGVAGGKSRIRNFLRAEDTMRTLQMMQALGVGVSEVSPTELVVQGVGLHGLSEPKNVLDAGNSGTTMRIGAGLLAGQPFVAVLTGDQYLRERPMDRVMRPLCQMGALIKGRAGDTRAPICFFGGRLEGLRHESKVASAQVKSALLLAGLRASGPVTVVEPAKSRDHTERMLRAMGARVLVSGLEVTVEPAQRLEPLDILCPSDFSSAAFFLVLAAATPGSELRVKGVCANPLRTGLLGVLRRMGAEIALEDRAEVGGEVVADMVVRGQRLHGTYVGPDEIPALIDEVPALCVAAALAEGATEIRGAGELRVKESDRLATMAAALSALGTRCTEYPDGIRIEGGSPLRSGVLCDTRGDHRVAMALATLGAATGVRIGLTDTACVATSFPTFFEQLRALV